MERLLSRYRVSVVAGILVIFGVLYAMLSLGNHMMFRTYGLDLGVYTKTLYDYAHLHVNDCTFFLREPSNQLSDHFDLHLILLSPLVYVFGEYTLLIVQLMAVLLGMLGMYRLAKLFSDSEWLAMLAMLLLALQFGVWHAASFDYHSNVVSAMLLPWLLYFVGRQKTWGVVLMAAAIAIAKETSALWVTFVLVALLWDWRRDRQMRQTLGFTALGCLVYFLTVTIWVMPALGSGGSTGFWRYSWMGDNVVEMARWIVAHPLQAIHDIFVDFNPGAECTRFKTEFFVCALLSGGVLLILKPNYLLMLVPPVAMKMLSCDNVFWGVGYQYNAEVAAVLAVSTIAAVKVLDTTPHLHNSSFPKWLVTATVICTLCTLLYTVGNPQTIIRKDSVRVFDARHWRQSDFDIDVARRMLKQIPLDASVCATSMFTTHLITRENIYLFPVGTDYGAEYYMLLKHHWCYAGDEEAEVAKIINDTKHYRVVDTDGIIYLLQKK